jgi:hypothetical protein
VRSFLPPSVGILALRTNKAGVICGMPASDADILAELRHRAVAHEDTAAQKALAVTAPGAPEGAAASGEHPSADAWLVTGKYAVAQLSLPCTST